MITEEHYLGDGLYVRWDGCQIILRAPRIGGDDFVALEPLVLKEFEDWVANLKKELNAHRDQSPRGQ